MGGQRWVGLGSGPGGVGVSGTGRDGPGPAQTDPTSLIANDDHTIFFLFFFRRPDYIVILYR